MKFLRNFVVKNSQRVFYLTGGALLLAIFAFILMQFVSWDEDFLKSQVPQDSSPKLGQAVEAARGQSLEEKLDAGTVPTLIAAAEIDEEEPLDRETREELEKVAKDFLRTWEEVPQKDYREKLAPFVLPESLSAISEREDSFDNPLLDCQERCLYSSSFPAQEIPLKIVRVDNEHIQIAFSAFVEYKSIDGKRGELSGLQPRFYSLVLIPSAEGWLVARALARYA